MPLLRLFTVFILLASPALAATELNSHRTATPTNPDAPLTPAASQNPAAQAQEALAVESVAEPVQAEVPPVALETPAPSDNIIYYEPERTVYTPDAIPPAPPAEQQMQEAAVEPAMPEPQQEPAPVENRAEMPTGILQEAPVEAPLEAPVEAPVESKVDVTPAEQETAEKEAYVLPSDHMKAVQPEAPTDEAFRDALAQVYSNNPQIKAQREALNATDESVSQAVSGFMPTITAGAAKGRERASVNHQPDQYGDTTSKALDVVQPVFNGGESYASYQNAKERVKAGRAALTAVEQQVLYNAIVAYTDVVEKQSVLEVNQNNVDVLTKQLEATRARFEVGELTRTDSAQAEARLAAARSAERQALGDLESARATYKRVIGSYPAEKVTLPPLPTKLPVSLDEANELALAAHPSLLASKYLEQAADKTVDVRTAALLPDVTINGSMSSNEGVSATTGGNSRVDNDAITLNLSVPLYQSGAEWSRIREAKNLAQQAKFTTIDTQDAVAENVYRAWQDYTTAQAIIASSEEALNAAEVALDGINQENQSGLRTILDVLDTEQEAFNARLNLVKARRQEKTQAYRLLAAVGRLTAKDLGLPVALHDPHEHYDGVKYKLIGW